MKLSIRSMFSILFTEYISYLTNSEVYLIDKGFLHGDSN
ncbi:hypothetical protein QOZ98_000063 [Planomicrobium stackebrandtii]|uniref:Uncharacterized protein n=1 Tax=Planomicrobium stackebrandtii TaxID=253160 RepID=A0ABU0GQ93_9BACL|nr:hypothetical protein [Planomicrobium stackebrandtii]